jgi:hypothetical protein
MYRIQFIKHIFPQSQPLICLVYSTAQDRFLQFYFYLFIFFLSINLLAFAQRITKCNQLCSNLALQNMSKKKKKTWHCNQLCSNLALQLAEASHRHFIKQMTCSFNLAVS